MQNGFCHVKNFTGIVYASKYRLKMTEISCFMIVTGLVPQEKDEMTQVQSSTLHACPGAT